MRKLAFRALTVAILAFAPLAMSARAEPLDPSATVDEFHLALKAGNGARAVSLLDDKVVIYEEGEAELSKAQYMVSHLQADIAFTAGMSETVTARSTAGSGDLAWVATQARVRGEYRGRNVDRETAETMVLRRTAGGWRIVHIHWSSKAR